MSRAESDQTHSGRLADATRSHPGLTGAKREPEGHKISFDDQTTRKLSNGIRFSCRSSIFSSIGRAVMEIRGGGGIAQYPPPVQMDCELVL